MKKLTKAEEEIMQIIWEIAPCTVSDIRTYMVEELGLKKPPHSTVSTMVRILDDKKGFLKHKAYGRTFVYEPAVTKEAYSRQSVQTLVQDYFGGSMNRLVSFLVQEEDLSLRELNDLMEKLEEE
ncbi:MAG: BlaI/MecI/CopY family transcriptional regulator [Phaeodactylibacter sp.]|uniref:BlaI/MecI/CopY family transcriptional regulator n=1 Tax=Phaeodactylibacter sp. TaxID=1940289 RepID=UPI0032EC5628